MPRSPRYLALLLALLAPAGFGAEKGAPDSLCAAGADSLRRGAIEAAARRFEEALSIDRGYAPAHAQLGSIHLELGDLKTAEGRFLRALRSDPRMVQAHVGLGRVYARTPYRRVEAIRCFQKALSLDRTCVEAQYHLAMTHLGLGDLDAKKAFKEVLRLDPGHPDASFRLGTILERHDRDDRAAAAAYERQLSVHPSHAEARTRLAEIYRKEGRYADALRVVDADRSRGAASESRRLLSEARIHLGRRDIEAAGRAFTSYVGTLSSRERNLYRDLRWVVGKEEAGRADIGTEEAFRRYWNTRDPTPLSEVNERLVEHYRRVAYSREHYGEAAFPWDRRGDIYIRYGEPDHVGKSDDIRFETDPGVIAVKDRFLRAVEAGAGDLSIDLTAPPPRRDRYRRMEVPVRQISEFRGRPTYPVRPGVRWEYWIYTDVGGGIEFTFTDELGNGRYGYAPVPYDLPLTSTRTWQAMNSERLLDVAMSRQPEYARPVAANPPLSMACQVATFAGDRDRSHLEVYWGVPLDQASPAAGDPTPGRLTQGLVLFDADGDERARHRETVTASVVADTGRDAFVPGRLVVSLPAGTYHLALQVENPETGATRAWRREVVVPAYAGGDLKLSDLELAASIQAEAPAGRFTRNGTRVLPMPSGVFRKGRPVSLYYEVYGLARDAAGRSSYRVSYSVATRNGKGIGARLAGGLGRLLSAPAGDGSVAILSERSGTDADEAGFADLDLTGAEPGAYQLRVEVDDILAGRRAARETSFRISP